jgi:hypothetical protein
MRKWFVGSPSNSALLQLPGAEMCALYTVMRWKWLATGSLAIHCFDMEVFPSRSVSHRPSTDQQRSTATA